MVLFFLLLPHSPLLVHAAGGGGGCLAPHLPLWLLCCPTIIWVARGHLALLHMSPNLQTDLQLVFVGVVLW